MTAVLLWSCTEPSRPPVHAVQVPESPPTSEATDSPTEQASRLRVEVTADRTVASSARADLGELKRALAQSMPKLQACLAEDEGPLRELVTYYVNVDAKGAARPELKLTFPPATSDSGPECTEYDDHMGRCERIDQPSAPPEPPDVHRRVLDCWAEVLGALELPPSKHGPFRARVEIVPE